MPYKIYSNALILPFLPSRIDLGNLISIFDGDDVLWPQFGPAAESVGVDPLKLNNFIVKNNIYYTQDEKERIFEAFRNAKLFEQAEFYPGIEKMILLHELGIRIKIDSKSFTENISKIKRYRFKSALPFLQDSDLILTETNQDHSSSGKNIGKEVTFFIDDNPYNIVGSDAVYNLIPSKTWNSNPEEQYRMRSKNTYTFDSLDSILETIIKSVCFWQRTYSI